MPKISKTFVDRTNPTQKDQFFWDDELSGFGLKITPAARKVYILQYRLGGRNSPTRRLTLGVHGKLTTDQARSDAKAALRQVSIGKDPSAAKDAKKGEKSFGSLLNEFIGDHAAVKLKPRSSDEYRRLIDKLVPASLLRKPILEFQRSDIAKLHISLKGTPYQANRLLAVLSKFFNWCEKHGYRPDHTNPAYLVDKFKEEKRKRFLSELEIANLGQVLMRLETDGTFSPWVIAAIRLLSLTGARLSEILTLQWDWVDIENQCLRLPDSKTGAKIVYLNAPSMQVLSEVPRLENNPFVICGQIEGAHLVNLQKPWTKIRAIAGLNDVRIHDLRHSFASVAVASGMSLPLIGALLGHSQPQTTARYAHLSDDPLKTAARTVGERMKNIAGLRKIG